MEESCIRKSTKAVTERYFRLLRLVFTFECVTLRQCSVLGLSEDARLVTSEDTLEEASGDLK